MTSVNLHKPHLESLLTAQNVQQVITCSLPFVYKLAASGRLPAVRIPCPGNGTKRQRDLVRFKKADVLKFVEEYYSG